MNPSLIRILDQGLKIPELPALKATDEPLYFATHPSGVSQYQQLQGTAPGPLHIWVESEKNLSVYAEDSNLTKAHFVFPFQKLKPSQIVQFGSFQGPTLFEIPDPRLTDLSLLAPSVQVLQKTRNENPEFSLISPFFENEERTQKALSSWLALRDASFEIILVDDGSKTAWISTLVGQHPDHLTLLRLERRQERQRGDSLFRAGLARNIGFDHSKAEQILFVDSDMILPPDFLSRLRFEFQSHDVIMPERWQLSEEASQTFTNYQEIHFGRDTRLSPGAHWETFQTDTVPWSNHPIPWKWASSFCLALRRKDFARIGGFKKSFVTYGFEDSELCYRLIQNGARLQRISVPLYHLHQPLTHSEYQNDPERKNRLLRISADRFFRHHPGKDVYEALKEWLD